MKIYVIHCLVFECINVHDRKCYTCMLMILVEEFICDGHVDDIGRRICL